MDDIYHILPFSQLSDDEFIFVNSSDYVSLSTIRICELDKLIFNQLVPDDDRHNIDIDVDSFMANSRNLSIPQTDYKFLSDMDKNYIYSESKTLFSTLCFNIRSFSSNLQNFVDLCLNDSKFDIMAFQETRLNNSISSLFQLPGYCLYTQCRNTEGGGTALYVSVTYNSSLLPDLCFTLDYFECVAAEVKFSNCVYMCASIYRPPRGDTAKFISKLSNVLLLLSEKKLQRNFSPRRLES